MFRTISIRNFALIEDTELRLHEGLNVWTGETGSGKSLLLAAIGLVLGARADASSVRTGATEAMVSCSIDLSRPEFRANVEAIIGGLGDDDDLIIARRVNASTGKSSATVNALPVPVKLLQQLGREMVDYVGQHQTRSLAEPETQTTLLDEFGRHLQALEEYQQAHQSYESARLAHRQAAESLIRDQREKELLIFELEELERLGPDPVEPARLLEEARRLARADEIRKATSDSYARLYGVDSSIHDQIARMARRLSPVATLSETLKQATEAMEMLLDQVVELSTLLQTAAEESEADPKRLDTIEQRLADYRRLAVRLGTNEAGLVEMMHAHRARLDEMVLRQKKAADESELRGLWKRTIAKADTLFQTRAQAAEKLSQCLTKPLASLGMPAARLEISIKPMAWPEFGANPPGAPENPAPVQFLFQPNLGEPAQTLEKIASGGELSRLLLAILTCMAGTDRIPTVILDEIDTGVGGRLGGAVAEVLAELSKHHQVLCVTHLPQIAATADKHFLVRKTRQSGRTRTNVEELDDKALRLSELAQMIRGSKADALTLKQAEAMLTTGRKSFKNNELKNNTVQEKKRVAVKRSKKPNA